MRRPANGRARVKEGTHLLVDLNFGTSISTPQPSHVARPHRPARAPRRAVARDRAELRVGLALAVCAPAVVEPDLARFSLAQVLVRIAASSRPSSSTACAETCSTCAARQRPHRVAARRPRPAWVLRLARRRRDLLPVAAELDDAHGRERRVVHGRAPGRRRGGPFLAAAGGRGRGGGRGRRCGGEGRLGARGAEGGERLDVDEASAQREEEGVGQLWPDGAGWERGEYDALGGVLEDALERLALALLFLGRAALRARRGPERCDRGRVSCRRGGAGERWTHSGRMSGLSNGARSESCAEGRA